MPYIDIDLLKESILGWNPPLDSEQLKHMIDTIPLADVIEMSKVKDVIMEYIAEQTVSKYPTAELCRASRMGAEGVLYALEYAFEEVQNEQKQEESRPTVKGIGYKEN